MRNGRVWFVLVAGLALIAVVPGAPSAQELPAEPGPDLPDGSASADPAPTPPTELTFEQALHQLYAPRAEDRQAALRRLSEIADPAGAPNVAQVLRQDPDAEVRRFAAIALGNIGGVALMAAIGIPLWVLSSGGAELRPQAATGGSVAGLFLAPGLAGVDVATGRSVWGLNLTLAF